MVGLSLAACEKSQAAPATTAHAHDAQPHEHTHDGANPGFKAELASPGDVTANSPVTLAFTVKDAQGATVRELPLVHEKPMHLLVVSNDLKDFFHLHPAPQADGTFRVQHTFPSGGGYTAFVDFTPQGSPQVVERIPLAVKGAARAKAALQADTAFTRSVDGMRVTMTPGKPLRAGDGLMLQFAVTDEKTGKPVADLQPYLGAMAHFVILSEDLKDFLHAHPMDGATGSGTVSAHTVFPRAGLYKVWAQMQRNGKPFTVPFVLNVAEGPSASEHAEHHH